MHGLSAEEKTILVEVAKRMEEIRKTKAPPKWMAWSLAEWKTLRQYGPTYQPSVWFNGGNPLPEKARVRFLRAVHRLADAGLLERSGVGVRLQNLKLTPEGQKVAAELMGEAEEVTGEQ